jgi:two-component system sensor histidine kinase/response regulator
MSLRVEDTGMGMMQEDIGNLFKLFGKAKDRNNMNKNGTGLGLTICKKIAESMGGNIEVESTYGKGTTFKM